MKLTFSKAVRVLFGALALAMLHGCGESANGLGNDAQLTVSIPSANNANSSNRAAVARTAVPNYIRTITITVRDSAENIIASGEIPASGGDLSLTVPPNLALRVTAAALDESRAPRFTGTKDVAPIASGATQSVSLSLEALTPLSSLAQPSEFDTIAVADKTTDVIVITTNKKEDQRISFAITGGVDGDFFIIDASSGQLSFKSAPSLASPQDNNGDNVYEVQVTFTDGFESVIQNLKVSVGLSGSLDLGFGPNGTGIVTTDLSLPEFVSADIAKAVMVQSDGKIIVAGTTLGGSALVRYTANGNIDPSFGTKGIVRLTGAINAMALQSNDDIVVAGTAANEAGNDFLLASFTKDGQINTNFGTISLGTTRTGRVTTDFASLLGGQFTSNEQARALVIQADGKIVVVGETGNNPILLGDATDWNFAVARYQSNGILDPTFGIKLPNPVLAAANVNTDSYGFMITDIAMITDTASMGDYANAVALQGDTRTTSGKIVVAGYANFTATGDDFVILRYDNTGQLDISFNRSGMVNTDFGTVDAGVSADQATAVLIQTDGKIVVVGASGFNGLAIARYNEQGSLDPDFGVRGKVTSMNYSAYAAVLQSDGKLVIAGSYDDCGDGCLRFFAGRYIGDGSVDEMFGTNGRVITLDKTRGTAYAVGLQRNGKIIAAGSATGAMRNNDFAVVRYNP